MSVKINTKNSIFLCIDVQEKLVGMLENDSAAKKAEILVKAAKILKVKTVVTEQYPKGLGSTIPEVKENLPEKTKIIEKTDFNALDSKKVCKEIGLFTRNIFVFGIETHICVFQSALDLIGYQVFIVKDACASRNIEDHNVALNLLEAEGAKIITTEMVLFEMLKTSKHPDFKQIQALIK